MVQAHLRRRAADGHQVIPQTVVVMMENPSHTRVDQRRAVILRPHHYPFRFRRAERAGE